ncbi:hypothetical protein FPSM_01575 [Flavobacterium psychrophilum]|nr:hypothetical protein FPSM_01575 [Flavobacterium psychrophilum]
MPAADDFGSGQTNPIIKSVLFFNLKNFMQNTIINYFI